MPGTTTHGLPYPLGSEPFGDGAGAIQDLAEAVDDLLGVNANLERSANQSIPDGVSTNVTWTPGSSDLSPEFTFASSDTRLVYTGPTKWFTVMADGSWPTQSDSGTRTMTLIVTGAEADSEIDDVNPSAVPGQRGNKIRRILKLASGDYITLSAFQSTGSAKNFRPWLRIVGLS